MPLPLTSLFAVVLAWCVASAPAGAQPSDAADRARAAAAITAVRSASNAAIAAHDTAAIARAWLPDVHVLSSTGLSTTGADANARRMAEQFARRPDTRWVRTPTSIDVFLAWGVAAERGTWVGTWTEPDGPLTIEGSYEAQWRLVDRQWRIRAELFVPTACRGGAYCRVRP